MNKSQMNPNFKIFETNKMQIR